MHLVNAKGILSPEGGMNIYRGCAHGCIYCDARSACYGMRHDFEDIEVKINAPELLEEALSRKRKKGMLATGSMSDPYQPIERELKLTRRCMEIARDRGFGWTAQTKSPDILRDLDVMREIGERSRCVAQMTLTTAEDRLCRILEPRVAPTGERFKTLLRLNREGIPTVVWITPLLPHINDTPENLRALLDMCGEAGVKGIIAFGMGLTLREGDREYYYGKLDEYFPGLSRVYAREYGNRYELPSPRAAELRRIFDEWCERAGVMHCEEEIFAWIRDWPPERKTTQISLFDGA